MLFQFHRYQLLESWLQCLLIAYYAMMFEVFPSFTAISWRMNYFLFLFNVLVLASNWPGLFNLLYCFFILRGWSTKVIYLNNCSKLRILRGRVYELVVYFGFWKYYASAVGESVAVILQITSFLKFVWLQHWYNRFVGGDTNESYAIRITSMLLFLLHSSMNELWCFLIIYHIC